MRLHDTRYEVSKLDCSLNTNGCVWVEFRSVVTGSVTAIMRLHSRCSDRIRDRLEMSVLVARKLIVVSWRRLAAVGW